VHGSPTAEWITAVAALVALLGAAVTILDNRRTARRRITYEYLARLEDSALIEIQATMSSFMRGGMRPEHISVEQWSTMGEEARLETAKNMWQQLCLSPSLKDRETVLRIVAYPNMLEDLAGMYNDGLLDRRIVKTHVESEAKNFCEVAGWWLKELKSDPRSNTFRDIEVMLEDLAERKRPKWHH
jgi:hypothetical protein